MRRVPRAQWTKKFNSVTRSPVEPGSTFPAKTQYTCVLAHFITSLLQSMASTAFYYHVLVLLKDYVVAFVVVENRYCRELRRSAARLRCHVWAHEMDQSLNYGVVGGVHVCVQGEGTFAVTIKSLVIVRSNDPVLKEFCTL